MVYVKNNGQYKATFSVVEKSEVVDGTGRKTVVRTPGRTTVFGVFLKDSITGQVIHTGFTQLEEDEYEKLFQTNEMFQKEVTKGNLVKYDEAPKEALLDSQLLDNAYAEVQQLKEEIRQLNAVIASGGGKTAAKQIKELTEENEALKKELDALKNTKSAPAQKSKTSSATTEPEF